MPERTTKPLRPRLLYLTLCAAVVALGLAARRYRDLLPSFLGEYAGDTLWAALVYLLAAAAWPKARVGSLALCAGAFSLAIEVSQLYHAPWIDALRATRLGGLVLGFGFLWSDLACYSVGIAGAAVLDAAMLKRGRVSKGS
jgi:Protein of unknown function (DUF2809).